MVVCPNCNHENPEGATLCETCYAPLPLNAKCPNCGYSILSNSTFCGQCGFNLPEQNNPLENAQETIVRSSNDEVLEKEEEFSFVKSELKFMTNETSASEQNVNEELETNLAVNLAKVKPDVPHDPLHIPEISQPQTSATKLQIQKASLLHVQTNKQIELPQQLPVIHLGKENDKIPPDIDVSGFPNSQFVSRIHADIRVEGDTFYIEDTGSANGTYINHIHLPKGNRHRLRAGDRIALGKEDKISFIFQLSS
jgi:predicted component of type VI protein secretion system